MKKATTSAGAVPAAIVDEAWQEVGASFDRFCLTAGLATLAAMMEEDATGLCGPRYGRAAGRDGYRWGKTKGKVGFHGGKVEVDRPRVRGRDGGEVVLPSWEAALSEDLLGKWALNLMLINVWRDNYDCRLASTMIAGERQCRVVFRRYQVATKTATDSRGDNYDNCRVLFFRWRIDNCRCALTATTIRLEGMNG